ncbi:MAG: hypothetical protein RLZZ550_1750 [Verrucomicrobiota bacterium]|jgi:hypothetical protein
MRRLAGLLAGALLAGCAGAPAPETEAAAPANPFARPAGASRNLPVGRLTPAEPGAPWRVVTLALGHPLRGEEYLVTRDPELRPTGWLKVTRLDGRIAVATVLRGAPGPEDEAVLPSTDLTRAAQALPPRPPGS